MQNPGTARVSTSTEISRHVWIVLWLALSVIACLVLPPGGYRIDLDVYRTGATVWLNGGDIYSPLPALARGEHLPFTYPPIAAILFAPLS